MGRMGMGILMTDYELGLLFVGGVIGMVLLYAVSAVVGLCRVFRAGWTQRDRDAALLREVMEAGDRLQVSDRA